MLDTVQILFWSMTYVLIIIAGIMGCKEKRVSMPYVAGVLNFSWEICALLNSRGFWGHISWLLLDIGIVLLSFRCIRSNKNKFMYIVSILVSTILLRYVFAIREGMLFSVFVIDFIMAVWYLVDRKKLSGKLKISIACAKMLGDIFAGLYYAPESVFVAVLAMMVFFCNFSYLYLCIAEAGAERESMLGAE